MVDRHRTLKEWLYIWHPWTLSIKVSSLWSPISCFLFAHIRVILGSPFFRYEYVLTGFCVFLYGQTERKLLLYLSSIWGMQNSISMLYFSNNSNSKLNYLQSCLSSVLYWLSHLPSANILIFLNCSIDMQYIWHKIYLFKV